MMVGNLEVGKLNSLFFSRKKKYSFAERNSLVKIECQMSSNFRGAETSEKKKVDNTFDL